MTCEVIAVIHSPAEHSAKPNRGVRNEPSSEPGSTTRHRPADSVRPDLGLRRLPGRLYRHLRPRPGGTGRLAARRGPRRRTGAGSRLADTDGATGGPQSLAVGGRDTIPGVFR